jgi:hypothetical protein
MEMKMQHIDPYKIAKELYLTESERGRLIKVGRTILTDGERFDMGFWEHCIRGRMYPKRSNSFWGKLSQLFFPLRPSPHLNGLFGSGGSCWDGMKDPMKATREEAAIAVHNYLTQGP